MPGEGRQLQGEEGILSHADVLLAIVTPGSFAVGKERKAHVNHCRDLQNEKTAELGTYIYYTVILYFLYNEKFNFLNILLGEFDWGLFFFIGLVQIEADYFYNENGLEVTF